jgi:hypothetical protein
MQVVAGSAFEEIATMHAAQIFITRKHNTSSKLICRMPYYVCFTLAIHVVAHKICRAFEYDHFEKNIRLLV